MQVKQIASIMNEVFKEQLGEENLLTDNLSNVVSSGEIITSDSEVMSNFDNYAKKIIDKVGRTIFWDRVYKADDLGLWRDAFEYGSVLEKIRCDVGDYSDNCQWKLTEKTGDNLDYNTNIATHIAEDTLCNRVSFLGSFFIYSVFKRGGEYGVCFEEKPLDRLFDYINVDLSQKIHFL